MDPTGITAHTQRSVVFPALLSAANRLRQAQALGPPVANQLVLIHLADDVKIHTEQYEFLHHGPYWNRTSDLANVSRALWPAELRVHKNAGMYSKYANFTLSSKFFQLQR